MHFHVGTDFNGASAVISRYRLEAYATLFLVAHQTVLVAKRRLWDSALGDSSA